MLTLENDGRFYSEYLFARSDSATAARNLIDRTCKRLKLNAPVLYSPGLDAQYSRIHAREKMRAYFDDLYDIDPRPTDNSNLAQEHPECLWTRERLYEKPPATSDTPKEPDMATFYDPTQPTQKEDIMNAATKIIDITTKTLVNGVDISTMTDSQVYQLIADQENSIKELEHIEAKPKKLVAEIAKRKEGIAALVAHLDSKE